jgi:hypothetical protein
MTDNGFDTNRQNAEAIFDRARVAARAEAREWLDKQVAATRQHAVDVTLEWADRMLPNLTVAQRKNLKAFLDDRVRLGPTTD